MAMEVCRGRHLSDRWHQSPPPGHSTPPGRVLSEHRCVCDPPLHRACVDAVIDVPSCGQSPDVGPPADAGSQSDQAEHSDDFK